MLNVRLLLLPALLLAACTASPARLFIAVDTDYTIPGEVDSLRVVVNAPDLPDREAIASLGQAGDLAPPRTVEIRQAGDYRGPYSVLAQGLLGDAVVIEQTVDVMFPASGTLTVRIDLTQSCAGVVCQDGLCMDGRCESNGQDAGVAPDAGPSAVSEDEILGTWERAAGAADFGAFYLKRVGTDIRGIYESSEGRTVCDYDNVTELDCWWSEAPSRNGNNAGPLSFRITRADGGGLHAAGTWFTENAPADEHTDWGLDYVGPSIPDEVDAQFTDDAEFRDERP